MYAIEFEADVKNYSIKIPKEYEELESKHIKIFVVEVQNQTTTLPKGFLEPIQVQSYAKIAKRDDIYER